MRFRSIARPPRGPSARAAAAERRLDGPRHRPHTVTAPHTPLPATAGRRPGTKDRRPGTTDRPPGSACRPPGGTGTAVANRTAVALAVAVAVLAVLVPPAVTVAPGPRSGQERSAWGSAAGFLTGTRTPETGAPERRASEHRASEAWSATAAVRSGRTANAPRPEGTFTWPLTPRPAVVRPFDPPDSEYGPGHRGVDLAAEPGQPVSAAAAGRVVYAGDLAGRGVVSIEHRGGLRTTYEPLSVRVAEGDRVEAGRRIGTVARGHDGCRRAACLHWGLRRGERYLDPLTVVPVAGPLRLKPWPG